MHPRSSLLLLITLLVAGCSDPTSPQAPYQSVVDTSPIHIDTVYVMPGVTGTVALSALSEGRGIISARVIVSPMAGEAIINTPALLLYTSAVGSTGEDVLSYELTMANGGVQSGALVFMISSSGHELHGITIVRQAAVPLEERAERVRYQGVDLTDPRIRALKPLVREILAAYPTAGSALDTARIVRDWLARTAVHPYPPFHPDGNTANLSVLPPGSRWSDVNALYEERLAGDSNYWTQLYLDGPQMLERLLGTQGEVRDTVGGMMERVSPARYRIRNLDDYRFVLCSYQSQMLIALWAAAGLQGMMVPTLGHDGSAVFIADLGKWVYMDPTYNEDYTLIDSSTPLSPLELVTYSSAGYASSLKSRSIGGPSWDREPYIAAMSDPAASYIGEHPSGFLFIGSQLNNAVSTPFGVQVRHVQMDNAAVASDSFFSNQENFVRVIPSVAFPDLGVGISGVDGVEDGAMVHLVSSVPGHVHFERRSGNQPWRECPDVDFVARNSGQVEYRSVDASGASGMTAIITS